MQREDTMRADLVELSWNAAASNWLVRIESGEEVLRRHCQAPQDADESKLRSLVQKTLQDEGYDPDPAQILIKR
jgi:hypothetical protein